jgi:hypothetical protein
MDPDRAKKLSAVIWRERPKTAWRVLAVVFAVALLLVAWTLHQTPSEIEQLEAQLVGWTRVQTEECAGTYLIDVTLADGEKVTATASRYGRSPRIGEQIQVDKVTTLTGATKYVRSRR